VTVAAAVVPWGVVSSGSGSQQHRYRMFVRIDARHLLEALNRSQSLAPEGSGAKAQAQPVDWVEDEDGPWQPPAPKLEETTSALCVARYFQFTTKRGRHAPLSLWPAKSMCQLSLDSAVAHESFDMTLPEALDQVIGGAVLAVGRRQLDVKLPRMLASPSAVKPEWSGRCRHVGLVKMPQGEWNLDEPQGEWNLDEPQGEWNL
ncbi:unnamed protein product, partial [Polarella glacialis]